MKEIKSITRDNPTTKGHPARHETHKRYEHENDKGKQKMQQVRDVNGKISGFIAMKPYSNNLSKTATNIVKVEGWIYGGCQYNLIYAERDNKRREFASCFS